MVVPIRDTEQPNIAGGFPMTETDTTINGNDAVLHTKGLIQANNGFLHGVFVDYDAGNTRWTIEYINNDGGWSQAEIRNDDQTTGGSTLQYSKPVIIQSTNGDIYVFWLERNGTTNIIYVKWVYSTDGGGSWEAVQTSDFLVHDSATADTDLRDLNLTVERKAGGEILLGVPALYSFHKTFGIFMVETTNSYILINYDVSNSHTYLRINSYKAVDSEHTYFVFTEGITSTRIRMVMYDGLQFTNIPIIVEEGVAVPSAGKDFSGATIYGEENWNNVYVTFIDGGGGDKLVIKKYDRDSESFVDRNGDLGSTIWKEYNTGTGLWSEANAVMTTLRTPQMLKDTFTNHLFLLGIDDCSGTVLPVFWESDDKGHTWYRHDVGLESDTDGTDRNDICYAKYVGDPTKGQSPNDSEIFWIELRGAGSGTVVWYETMSMDFPLPPSNITIEDIVAGDDRTSEVTGLKDTTPEIKWTYDSPIATDMDKYQIQVSTDPSFASTNWDTGLDNSQTGLGDGVESAEVTCGITLTVGIPYYIRIRTEDTDGLVGAWNIFQIEMVTEAQPTILFKVYDLDDATKTKYVTEITITFPSFVVFYGNDTPDKSITHYSIDFGDGNMTYNPDDGTPWIPISFSNPDSGVGNPEIEVQHKYGAPRTEGYFAVCKVKNEDLESDGQLITIKVNPAIGVPILRLFPNPVIKNKEVTISGASSHAYGEEVQEWEFRYTGTWYVTPPTLDNLTVIPHSLNLPKQIVKTAFPDAGYQYIYHRIKSNGVWSGFTTKILTIKDLEIRDIHEEGFPYGDKISESGSLRTNEISVPGRDGNILETFNRNSNKLRYSGFLNNLKLRQPSGGAFWKDYLMGIYQYEYLVTVRHDGLGINFTGKITNLTFAPVSGTEEPTVSDAGSGGWRWTILLVEYTGDD